ncbi:MAG: hypothetical protein ACYC09_15240, partial [Bacteroidota bacterium]
WMTPGSIRSNRKSAMKDAQQDRNDESNYETELAPNAPITDNRRLVDFPFVLELKSCGSHFVLAKRSTS